MLTICCSGFQDTPGAIFSRAIAVQHTCGIIHDNIGPSHAEIGLRLIIHVPIWAPPVGGGSVEGVRDAVRIWVIEHIIHGDRGCPALRVQDISWTVVGLVKR